MSSAPQPRILLVDDDPSIVRMIHRLLRRDFEVTEAVDGIEAVELVRAGNPYDVILCDVSMPTMSGLEVLEAVTILQPRLSRKFVFITGGARSWQEERRLARTHARVLRKPFSVRVLLDVLEELIEPTPIEPTPAASTASS